MQKIIKEIKKTKWKNIPYKKQNWGNWFHSISPYVGRIKPAFAHWLIKDSTIESDLILDPFCGVGTVLLEADLLGRKSIGVDLNPYAIKIAKAKFDRKGLDREIEYLESIKINTSKINLEKVPNEIKQYYDKNTLKEILFLIDIFLKNSRHFLYGCLLGIVHGHRPQHLSLRTGYILPYIPNPKPQTEYREVIPRMIAKVTRMYKDEIKLKSNSTILHSNILNSKIKKGSIDKIISSPPYYNTLDYVSANRVRLWFSGSDNEAQNILKSQLFQHKNKYLEDMLKVGKVLYKTLKDKGLILFVLGDVHVGNKTIETAENISALYSDIGFNTEAIIKDHIPAEKTTIVKYGGKDSINKKKEKFDKILVLSKK